MERQQALRLIQTDVDQISEELVKADEKCEEFGNRRGENGSERHALCAMMFGDHELPKLLEKVAVSRKTIAKAISSGVVSAGDSDAVAMERAINFVHAKIHHYAAVNWNAAGEGGKASQANKKALEILGDNDGPVGLGLKARLQRDLGLYDDAIATYNIIVGMGDEEKGVEALQAIREIEIRKSEAAQKKAGGTLLASFTASLVPTTPSVPLLASLRQRFETRFLSCGSQALAYVAGKHGRAITATTVGGLAAKANGALLTIEQLIGAAHSIGFETQYLPQADSRLVVEGDFVLLLTETIVVTCLQNAIPFARWPAHVSVAERVASGWILHSPTSMRRVDSESLSSAIARHRRAIGAVRIRPATKFEA